MPSISELKKTIAAQDDEPLVLTIYQRNGEPYLAKDGETPATISVLGSESPKYRRLKAQEERRLSRSGGRTNQEEFRIARAAVAVTDWFGWYGDDSADVDPTQENIRALFTVEHILQQVEIGVGRHASFSESDS